MAAGQPVKVARDAHVSLAWVTECIDSSSLVFFLVDLIATSASRSVRVTSRESTGALDLFYPKPNLHSSANSEMDQLSL